MYVALQGCHGISAAPVTALKTAAMPWTMAEKIVMDRPQGIRVAEWFGNTSNSTQYTCTFRLELAHDVTLPCCFVPSSSPSPSHTHTPTPTLQNNNAVLPANTTWCRMDTSHTSSLGLILLVRSSLPDAVTSPTVYNVIIKATNPADNSTAQVPIVASLSAPRTTTRYPVANESLPLDQQMARQLGVWFVSTFPPQGFRSVNTYSGKDKVGDDHAREKYSKLYRI